jgi:hypothetical protein
VLSATQTARGPGRRRKGGTRSKSGGHCERAPWLRRVRRARQHKRLNLQGPEGSAKPWRVGDNCGRPLQTLPGQRRMRTANHRLAAPAEHRQKARRTSPSSSAAHRLITAAILSQNVRRPSSSRYYTRPHLFSAGEEAKLEPGCAPADWPARQGSTPHPRPSPSPLFCCSWPPLDFSLTTTTSAAKSTIRPAPALCSPERRPRTQSAGASCPSSRPRAAVAQTPTSFELSARCTTRAQQQHLQHTERAVCNKGRRRLLAHRRPPARPPRCRINSIVNAGQLALYLGVYTNSRYIFYLRLQPP